jgi:transglutaminase-like putative cysteine protease
MKQILQMQAQQREAFGSLLQAVRMPTGSIVSDLQAATAPPDLALPYRMFEVTDATHYRYVAPVERSTHVFMLRPEDDQTQKVERCSLTVSSDCEEIPFEDVFGNQAVHCTIERPYTTLSVQSSSLVRVYAAPRDDHSLSRRRGTVPPQLMPSQRQMMAPFLLPAELPETQLLSLGEYAAGFVARSAGDLLATIEDINLSIHRDYAYVPDSTGMETTPYQVYASRKGVCQDFANLFICLMRLLGIPARYRMGYIFTGANYANKSQSEASHAWAEVYLPYVGWRGFDPTNGCTIGQDHIRVASGRNFRDTAPTSGTIFAGGGGERLSTDVKVREL